MRRIGFLAFLLAGLAGCALTEGGGAPRLDQVTPQPPPEQLAGIWTESASSHAMAIRLDRDGRGLYCSGSGGQGQLKYADGQLYLQDGRRFSLERDAQGALTASPERGGDPLLLMPDSDLEQAAPSCRERLRRPYL